MTAKQKLERLQTAMDDLDEILDVAFDVIGLAPDGRLTETVNDVVSVAIKATAESAGIGIEALEWFIWENGFGKKGLECQNAGEPEVKIDSIDAFLRFEGIK